jgi:hypothetical protein
MSEKILTTLWIATSDGLSHAINGENWKNKEQIRNDFANLGKEIVNNEIITFGDHADLKSFFTQHIVGMFVTTRNPEESGK